MQSKVFLLYFIIKIILLRLSSEKIFHKLFIVINFTVHVKLIKYYKRILKVIEKKLQLIEYK